MMDANKVLENTLSPDAATRANAESQLNQAAEQNFPVYILTLAQALANEQAQPHVRTAAGLALKNSFSFREFQLLQKVQRKWLEEVDTDTKKEVKRLALQTLRSQDGRAGQAAGQFIAAIAAFEVPRNEWPELMQALVENVGTGADALKQSSLTTLGYICDTEDPVLRESLKGLSNVILTAVVQGSRKEEANADVRLAGITALSDCMDFVRTNFENEGERNYIMQVVCEATQAEDSRIQAAAFGCLNRIVGLYYDKMKFYMEKALYGLCIIGMRSEDEDVAKLAIEFWCTVCEEEISIDDDNLNLDDSIPRRINHSFSRVAAAEALPTLLQLLTQQEDDDSEDEYNVQRAAYNCLALFATAVGNDVVQVVTRFVEENVRHSEWQNRDAAVSAFGAIMDGPSEELLDPLVRAALAAVVERMQDDEVRVRDSAAYTLGRICEYLPRSIDEQSQLPTLIETLFNGVSSNPRTAASSCLALMHIADNFSGEQGCETNALSPQFQASVSAVLAVTEKTEDSRTRVAAYEVLAQFISNAATDSLPVVASVTDMVLNRLQNSVDMQAQVVSIEDRMTLEEMQTSLLHCLSIIINRLEGEIRPLADRIMELLLRLLTVVNGKSAVPDGVFTAIGGMANAISTDMDKYMDAFLPFLHQALGNHDEPGLCAMAIGLVSDLMRALEDRAQPYCDQLMNYLLEGLKSPVLGNQCKPAILQCFGDVAHAIGPNFENYLQTVAAVLIQASNVNMSYEGGFEMLEYMVSLREGVMDAWSGAIFALKNSKPTALAPFIDPIFQLLNMVATDGNRTEGLMRASLGVLGDLADTFPNGQYAQYFNQDWVIPFIKDVRLTRSYSNRTRETARWAKEQIRRQNAAAGM